MPPCNWPQNSVFVTEFALWRSLCSSTLSREERGSIAFALLWLCLRKLFRQLLFVACNAVSSYPLLTASHPQVDHKAIEERKTALSLSTLVSASVERCSFSILPPVDCVDWRTPVWNHLLGVSQVLISIALTFLF